MRPSLLGTNLFTNVPTDYNALKPLFIHYYILLCINHFHCVLEHYDQPQLTYWYFIIADDISVVENSVGGKLALEIHKVRL